MATATQTEVDLMEQARQLQEEAATDLDEYRQMLAQANEKLAERNDKLRQAGELLTQAAEQEPFEAPMNGTPAKPAAKRPATGSAVRPATPTPKRPANAPAVRPVPAKPAAAARTVPAKPAAPRSPAPAAKRPAAPAAAERKAKVEPHERNYGQDTSLRKEIWAVLDREPSSYKQYLPDYPDGAVGLKISELKEIIEQEGKWTSKAENISPQIQGHLHDLKKDGKIHRNEEDRRYFIVEGATLSKNEEAGAANAS